MTESGDEQIPVETRVIADPVHNTIRLHPLATKIIDTKEFQRLKKIKHLGPVSEVYPGATHTTFCYSLGVYHLAGQVGATIESRFNELEGKSFNKKESFLKEKITKVDILCLQIAGLCCHLGQAPCHGAFEEVFDLKRHKMSAEIFCNIYSSLKEDFKSCGIKDDQKKLIEDMIKGKEKTPDLTPDEKRKFYLYQVVNNRDSGVDVAKWESLTRDAQMCALKSHFNYERVINMLQVCETDKDVLELCFRDRDADVVYSMFRTHYEVDHKIYKHKVVYGITEMYKGIFREIKDSKNFICSGSLCFLGRKTDAGVSLNEMSKESCKFVLLDDTLFTLMSNGLDDTLTTLLLNTLENTLLTVRSNDPPPEVQRVTETLERIGKRDFHKCLFEMNAPEIGAQQDTEDKRLDLQATIDKIVEGTTAEGNAYVELIDFLSENTFPREKLRFYSKENLLRGKTHDTELWDVIPAHIYISNKYRVYYKDDKNSRKRDKPVLTKVVDELQKKRSE